MNTAPRLRRHMMIAFGVAGTSLAAAPALAQDVFVEQEVDEVVVTGRYVVTSLSSPKQTQPLVETAQTIVIVPDQLLQEQGRRTLRDTLRNVTGISIQAGEGNPPAGDALKIRGFSARDDIFVDGARDVGSYFRDPFNAERVEITKGPASAMSGRGSVGGTINIVTRQPDLTSGGEVELSVGTDDFRRATIDQNIVLDAENGTALRLNLLAHSADEPGRDQVRSERWAINPAIAFGLGMPTTLLLNHLHMKQDDVPDYGLPNARNRSLAGSGFEGRVAPVDRANFYGYSTDYRDTTADITTARVTHSFNDAASVRSQFRYGRTHVDAVASAPRFVGNVSTLTPQTQAVGNRKPRDQTDTIFLNQTDLNLTFDTGGLAHTLVAGFEVSRETLENERRLDANGPNMSLADPVLQPAPFIRPNGTRVEVETDVASAYLFDNIELSPLFEINLGLRYDTVDTRVQSFDATGTLPGFVVDLAAEDANVSYSASIVYKPAPNTSVYLAHGTAFETSGRADIVQVAGGNNNPPSTTAAFDVDPEKSESWELGAKRDVMAGRLNLAAALFRTTKTNARTPGVNPGDPAIVLDGEQRIDGLELSVVGALTDRWDVFAGYTWLDGEITRSNNPLEQGASLDNTPQHSASLWTAYDVTSGLRLGGGIQYVSERTSDVPASATGNFAITAPAFTVVDLFATYRLSDRVAARLNVYNVGDELYYQSFSSAQGIPAAARAAHLSLQVSF